MHTQKQRSVFLILQRVYRTCLEALSPLRQRLPRQRGASGPWTPGRTALPRCRWQRRKGHTSSARQQTSGPAGGCSGEGGVPPAAERLADRAGTRTDDCGRWHRFRPMVDKHRNWRYGANTEHRHLPHAPGDVQALHSQAHELRHYLWRS